MASRIKYPLLLVFLMAFFSDCGKNAGSLDYGSAYIYMPQSVQSGTSTSIVYNVPSGIDSATYNYVIDTANNKLNIVLGVLRSGKLSNDGFSVGVSTNTDTINAAIANGSLAQAPDAGDAVVPLPAGSYTLPQTVTVPSGQYQTTFYLSVDITQLKTLAGKKAALAVYLTNPSKYQLDTVNAMTIVLIDIDSLHLTAPAADSSATSLSLAPSVFSLWGTCSDYPYLISGTDGIAVPSGAEGCGTNYVGAQQSNGQTAVGMQFYGAFKGGTNAPDGSNEMAVFICTDVINWTGHEMGFIKTLNDDALKAYVQGNGNYFYQTLSIGDEGYHSFKCMVDSTDHTTVDFYVDGNYTCSLQNPGVNYWDDFYYFVGTTHRTSDGWSSAGQQIEMYDMAVWYMSPTR